jgi:hypothetical protein
LRVEGSGFRVQGSEFQGFRVWGLGLGFRVRGLGLGVKGFRVQGSGFREGGLICAFLEREVRERLERKDKEGWCSDSHFTGFHRWIRPRFEYVVNLIIVFILTGGIVQSCRRLGNLIV